MAKLSDLGVLLPTVLPPTGRRAVARSEPPSQVAFVQPTMTTGKRPFRTGFCGPSSGPCKDKNHKCPRQVRNGSSSPDPFYTCTCTCH